MFAQKALTIFLQSNSVKNKGVVVIVVVVVVMMVQWEPFNVITLGQTKDDDINQMITITGELIGI